MSNRLAARNVNNVEPPGSTGGPVFPPRRHERFESLDAMRGLAAAAVVVFHMAQVRLEPPYASHGYLAVDFFFLMSGFVVAVAYSKALRSTVSFTEFFLKRSIRLYPVSVFGAVLGLLVLLMKHFASPERVDSLASILLSGAFNIFLLPDFFTHAISHFELFPVNPPMWSLFFELFINIFWAWLVYRLRGKLLAFIIAGSWLLLTIAAIEAGTFNIGFDRMTFLDGLVRVFFGFLAGVGMYELWARGDLPSWRSHPGLAPFVMIVVLFTPAFARPVADVIFCILAISLVFPALLILCLAHETVGRLGQLSGTLSYPIYAVHFPLLLLASGLHQAKPRLNVHAISLVTLALIVAFGYFLSERYDKPLRRLLTSRLLRSPRRRMEAPSDNQ